MVKEAIELYLDDFIQEKIPENYQLIELAL
jgi:hypothetical protein